jgi:hypothetical protein
MLTIRDERGWEHRSMAVKSDVPAEVTDEVLLAIIFS